MKPLLQDPLRAILITMGIKTRVNERESCCSESSTLQVMFPLFQIPIRINGTFPTGPPIATVVQCRPATDIPLDVPGKQRIFNYLT